MVKKPTAVKRARRQMNIAEYERRRQKVKEKYGRTSEYKQRVKKIQTKIGGWNRDIKRIDERNNKIRAIGNALSTFIGYNVKDMGGEDSSYGGFITNTLMQTANLAACIFSKYGMENGIAGNFLSEYMNRPSVTASRLRLSFTRSWTKDPTKKDMYLRFKEYIKNITN